MPLDVVTETMKRTQRAAHTAPSSQPFLQLRCMAGPEPWRGELGSGEAAPAAALPQRPFICRPRACSSCRLEERPPVGAECEAEFQALPAAGARPQPPQGVHNPTGALPPWWARGEAGWGGRAFRGWLPGPTESTTWKVCQRRRGSTMLEEEMGLARGQQGLSMGTPPRGTPGPGPFLLCKDPHIGEVQAP